MSEAIPGIAAPKVFEAVATITKELSEIGISKSSKGALGYKYRGIDAVYSALSPLLAKHKLVIFPASFEMLEQSANKSGWIQCRAVVHYQVVSGEDGSHFEAAAMGEGLDKGDKASGKLMSYAYKNLMFQLFCIPVEGQPDPDQDGNERPADMEPVRKPAPVRQASASEQGFEPYHGEESPLDPRIVGEIRAAATRTALSQIADRLSVDEKDLYRNEFVAAWKRAPKES